MKQYRKQDYPVADIRRFLEPGPVVLVSSQWQGQHNVMTMGWHMILEFTPSLFGCLISPANHSYQMVQRSKQCVINLPTAELIDQVVTIGNSSGADVDKFAAFGLTPVAADIVQAPLIAECYASFEMQLIGGRQNPRDGLFIWECVKAHVAQTPRLPETLHYRGDGQFMISGRTISRRSRFKPEML